MAEPLTPEEFSRAYHEILDTVADDGSPLPPEIQFQHYARAGQIWGARLFATIESSRDQSNQLTLQLARVNYLWGQEAIVLKAEIDRLRALLRTLAPPDVIIPPRGPV